MLSHFSRVRLFVTPWTVAHQAPLSVGFSRQECWSGLPFSSPGDLPEPRIKPMSPALAGGFFTTSVTWEIRIEKRKVKVLVTQLCLTLCNPMDCSPPGSSVHEVLQTRILEWVAIPFSRGFSWPRDWTHGSCTAGRFFTIWPPGNPLCDSTYLIFVLRRN